MRRLLHLATLLRPLPRILPPLGHATRPRKLDRLTLLLILTPNLIIRILHLPKHLSPFLLSTSLPSTTAQRIRRNLRPLHPLSHPRRLRLLLLLFGFPRTLPIRRPPEEPLDVWPHDDVADDAEDDLGPAGFAHVREGGVHVCHEAVVACAD